MGWEGCIYKELRRNKSITVVFAKQERSEPDFYIQEEWVDWAFGRITTDTGSRVAILPVRGKGAVLSDPGHACKYNWYAMLQTSL